MIRVSTHGLSPGTPAFREALEPALECILAGGLVAFPTDTVWGLGARADRADSVERIFQLKRREKGKPLACLIPSLSWLETTWPDPLSEELTRILAEGWPGGLTLILEAPASLLPAPRRGAPGLGVRVPGHDHLRDFLELLDLPLANSSANPSGVPTPRDAEGVQALLGDGLDVLLDMPGELRGRPSRILSYVPDEPLRTMRS